MIKRLITVFTLVIFATTALLLGRQALSLAKSSTAADTMATANQLYQSGQFELAAQSYQQLADQGFANSALYFNLGNAYFEQNNLGRAILNYRLAQQLAPRDSDITANLELARAKVAAQSGQIETAGSAGWPERIAATAESWFTVNQLALLALAAWLLFALLVIAAGSLRRDGRLKGALRLALVTCGLVLAVGVIALGSLLATRSLQPPGVVVAPEVSLAAGPAAPADSEFTLPGGTEITVLETRGNWRRLAVPHSSVHGWVPAGAVERVEF